MTRPIRHYEIDLLLDYMKDWALTLPAAKNAAEPENVEMLNSKNYIHAEETARKYLKNNITELLDDIGMLEEEEEAP